MKVLWELFLVVLTSLAAYGWYGMGMDIYHSAFSGEERFAIILALLYQFGFCFYQVIIHTLKMLVFLTVKDSKDNF